MLMSGRDVVVVAESLLSEPLSLLSPPLEFDSLPLLLPVGAAGGAL